MLHHHCLDIKGPKPGYDILATSPIHKSGTNYKGNLHLPKDLLLNLCPPSLKFSPACTKNKN